jgi:UDP-N-acetylmuramate--alanine ligase
MHIFFSGIGGTGIGPLALIAAQAGYEVSGSDKQESQYIEYLRSHGITNIHIGQTTAAIASLHDKHPIDWFVYSSALPKEDPHHPELEFVDANAIKHSNRDDLLNQILADQKLKLIAVAGTHGKTTTTAMVIWLFKELGLPLSYSVGAKISFGEMGQFTPGSEYFAYECDEFDRNFLAFEPSISLITGVTWDHHEIYPTREDYQQAFHDFIDQSEHTFLWQEDFDYLGLSTGDQLSVQDSAQDAIHDIRLAGLYNRLDAWLAVQAVQQISNAPLDKLIEIISRFPGSNRRMEQIAPNLYSDYAHTPEKIVGAMSVALEMAATHDKKVVVIYEPLTNRRMHYMAAQHLDVFAGASAIYWVRSYLAREDPAQAILTPAELIKNLNPELESIAQPMELDDRLKQAIQNHLDKGDMVVAMSGGGGDSLDEWLRGAFA